MKRHASFPKIKNFKGVCEVIGGLVEQHIAQPAAHYHPEHTVKDDVFQVAHRHRRFLLLDSPPPKQPGRTESRQIH